MTEFSLHDMSFAELKKLEKELARTISGYAERQKAEARSEVEAVARKFGFSLSELVGAAAPVKRSTAVAKYRHPENADLTWSGRGRKPGWITEGLARGKSLEDFAI